MATFSTQNQQAYEYLHSELIRGTFRPGDRLSDYALSKKLNIGRSPIREAMGRLESEGFVEQVPRHGTFVRKLERSQVEDLYDLRILLEGHATEQAATRITDADLEMLGRIVGRLREILVAMRDRGGELDAEQVHEWVSLDVAFHMVIVRASGNTEMGRIIVSYRLMTKLLIAKPVLPAEACFSAYVHTWSSHKRILRALRRGDGQTAKCFMSRHISRAKTRVIAGYDRHEQQPSQDQSSVGSWSDDISELIARAERFINHSPDGSRRDVAQAV